MGRPKKNMMNKKFKNSRIKKCMSGKTAYIKAKFIRRLNNFAEVYNFHVLLFFKTCVMYKLFKI